MRNPRNISLQSQSGGSGDTFDPDDIVLHEYNEAGEYEIQIAVGNDGNLVLKA